MSAPEIGAPDGIVVVDKPAGWTSHDVVARVRKLAGTRRVGHAGTLDPMATGVLVIGVGRATRLLGHLALTDKVYEATIRLGETTVTDDAEGEVVSRTPAGKVTEEQVRAGIAKLTGVIQQVPSAVSAIKVDGQRAYARVRAGEAVELKAREVTVHTFDVLGLRRGGGGGRGGEVLDVDVRVTCSSGTYIRALARDLGAELGVGGHLTMLRRTQVGAFDVAAARTLDELADSFAMVPLAAAAADSFPRRDVGADEARTLGHGGRLSATGTAGPVAVFDPEGTLVALVEDRDGTARPLAVFAPR